MTYKEVAILGKKFKKNRKINLISKDIKRTKIYNLKTFNEIKKFQPKVISICSPFEKHSEHLLKCKKYCKNFIVEKPFFWIKNKSEDYNYYYAKKLLKENNFKLFINLPMISLANQIIYRKEVFKVKNFVPLRSEIFLHLPLETKVFHLFPIHNLDPWAPS